MCKGRATEHDAIAGQGAVEKAEWIRKKCDRLSHHWHTAVHSCTKKGAPTWLRPKERPRGDEGESTREQMEGFQGPPASARERGVGTFKYQKCPLRLQPALARREINARDSS